MNFISLSFLGFGVVLFALWWALPARLRPWVLAAANVYFALSFGAQALTALVLITAAGWLCGLWMAHGGGKAALAAGHFRVLFKKVFVVVFAAHKSVPFNWHGTPL